MSLAVLITLPPRQPDYDRGPARRFISRDLRDEKGNKLVLVDPLEVERRLKARGNDDAS